MDRLVRAAVAATTAGLLLVLAQTVVFGEGAGPAPGRPTLSTPRCGWTLDGAPTRQPLSILPGGELQRTCVSSVSVTGGGAARLDSRHKGGLVGGKLARSLGASTVYRVNGVLRTLPTSVVDGDVVQATLAVDYPDPAGRGSTDSSSPVTARVGAVTMTVSSLPSTPSG